MVCMTLVKDATQLQPEVLRSGRNLELISYRSAPLAEGFAHGLLPRILLQRYCISTGSTASTTAASCLDILMSRRQHSSHA